MPILRAVEHVQGDTARHRQNGKQAYRSSHEAKKAAPAVGLDTSAEIRFSTGISEFDRVLGGGAVVGSLVLVGGAPGIGKSTLLLQMCGSMENDRKVLYVTGGRVSGS